MPGANSRIVFMHFNAAYGVSVPKSLCQDSIIAGNAEKVGTTEVRSHGRGKFRDDSQMWRVTIVDLAETSHKNKIMVY